MTTNSSSGMDPPPPPPSSRIPGLEFNPNTTFIPNISHATHNPSSASTNLPSSNPLPTPSPGLASASITDPTPPVLIFDLLTALLDSWTLWNLAAGNDADRGRLWRSHYLSLTYGCGPYVPYETLVHRAAALTPDLSPSAPDHLVQNWTALKAWDDVPEVLWALHKRGCRLGVVTNCSRALGRQAVRGLEAAVNDARRSRRGDDSGSSSSGTDDDADAARFGFDTVVTAEEVGWYKPARQTYAACLAQMGMTGREGEVVFVAGSSADVPGARRAGMRVVWHNRVGLARVDGGGDGDGEGCGGLREEREGRTLRECLPGVVP